MEHVSLFIISVGIMLREAPLYWATGIFFIIFGVGLLFAGRKKNHDT
jgi:putative Ca2+/H+ antiporter (TMEM165/GDT1 family)